MAEGNGNGPKVTATLTLTFDLLEQKLDIGGEVPCFDTALDMLARATRHFEAQLRIQAAMAIQSQQMDNARTQAILNKFRGRA